MNHRGRYLVAVLLMLALFAGACGSDSDDDGAGSDGDSEAGTGEVTQNACPADGCSIDFGELANSGDEIEITWDMNFAPDINNNHIHVYWDTFEAAQVSNDATERDVEQGDWVPTDSSPTYVTDGPASTSARGDSTTLCLVAADRDHNVIDESTEICRDVSEFL